MWKIDFVGWMGLHKETQKSIVEEYDKYFFDEKKRIINFDRRGDCELKGTPEERLNTLDTKIALYYQRIKSILEEYTDAVHGIRYFDQFEPLCDTYETEQGCKGCPFWGQGGCQANFPEEPEFWEKFQKGD